jgi:5'-3' exonuclease
MIILDMNQISLAGLMMHLNMEKTDKPDVGMVRHMILNSIRMHRQEFNEEYGEIVLAYDSKHYWRRDFFPHYKQNRRKARSKDSKDWESIFECLNKIKQEIKDYLPYKVIEVHGAEADDVIGTLAKKYPDEKIMIVSGDKDFIQLQKFSNVSQYSPILKKTINGEDPNEYIKVHILKGDSSDGIPNVLSNDNVFVEGLRQKPLSKKKIEAWKDGNFDNTMATDEVVRNYSRNKNLIDLECIPVDIQTNILKEFSEAPCGDRSKMLTYFIENKLKELTDSIGDF